jgi:hypothetical protein
MSMAESSAPAAATKPGTVLPSSSSIGPEREWRRDTGEEAAELGVAERVHLHLDRSAALGVPNETRFGRDRSADRGEDPERVRGGERVYGDAVEPGYGGDDPSGADQGPDPDRRRARARS